MIHKPSRCGWIDLPYTSEPFIGLYVLFCAALAQQTNQQSSVPVPVPEDRDRDDFSSQREGTLLAEKDASSPHSNRICAVYASLGFTTATPFEGNLGNGCLSTPQCHSAGDLVVRSSTSYGPSVDHIPFHRDALA